MISPDTTTVAFIGTGVMGSAMAAHLIEAGYDVVVYNRTKSKAASLLDAGASWADSVEHAVSGAQVVISMVGYPADVEEIYMGDAGIIESAAAGTYLIDMTTSSPKLAREIHAMAAVNDLHAIDAPVTGGDIGAKAGTLTIFVGGDHEDLVAVTPVFSCMGKRISYHGESGMGQTAKLSNQIALAGSMMGTLESLAFAKQAGLDLNLIIEDMESGTADGWTLHNIAPRIVAQDYTPGFFVKHFVKDMGIALAAADELELTLPALETAYQLYSLLSQVGGENMGTQALSLIYEDEDTCRAHGLDWSLADYDEDDDDDDFGDDEDEDGEDLHHHDHGHDRGHGHGRGNGPIIGMDSFFSPN